MGNITVSEDYRRVFGDQKVSFGKLNLSSSYSANGDSFTADQFGFTKLSRLILNRPIDGLNHYIPDYANKKIEAYISSSGAEVTATDDLSGNDCDFIAIGK